METALGLKFRGYFFDRQVVIDAIEKKDLKAKAKHGNTIKKTAQRSMRYRKKPSAPGTPPSAHKDTKRGPLIRKLLFNTYDPATKTQLIGPVGLGKATVPAAQERGGPATVKVIIKKRASKPMSPAAKAAYRRKVLAGAIQATAAQQQARIINLPARPFMKPAERNTRPKFAREYAG